MQDESMKKDNKNIRIIENNISILYMYLLNPLRSRQNVTPSHVSAGFNPVFPSSRLVA